MKKFTCFLRFNISGGFLFLLLFLGACKPEELEVVTPQTCDTLATVKYEPECGLVLMLSNKQLLVPVNANQLPDITPGLKQFKINGFQVREGQQVIIGFTSKETVLNTCLKEAQQVDITCIVGYEVQL